MPTLEIDGQQDRGRGRPHRHPGGRPRSASRSRTTAGIPGSRSPATAACAWSRSRRRPKLQIACNTRVDRRAWWCTRRARRPRRRRRPCSSSCSSTTRSTARSATRRASASCKTTTWTTTGSGAACRSTSKVHKGKAIQIGPHVMLDQERCILCARCTRFFDEVTKTQRARRLRARRPLRASSSPRARRSTTRTRGTSSTSVRSARSPARTSASGRASGTSSAPSRSARGCANGCNIEIYHREGRIFRFQPRFNPDVNHYWMCDDGRMTAYERCRARAGCCSRSCAATSAFAPADWPTALAGVGDAAASLRARTGRGAVGIIVSAQASNEEIFLLRRLGERARRDAARASRGRRPTPITTTSSSRRTRTRTRRASCCQERAARRRGRRAARGRRRRERSRRSCSCRTDLTRVASTPARCAPRSSGSPYLVVLDTERRETARVRERRAADRHARRERRHVHEPRRSRAALPARGRARQVRPARDGQVLGDLLARLTGEPALANAEAVFAALAARGRVPSAASASSSSAIRARPRPLRPERLRRAAARTRGRGRATVDVREPAGERRAVAAERASGERARRTVEHRTVVMAEEEQHAGNADRPESVHAVQHPRRSGGGEAVDRLEIATSRGLVACQPAHPGDARAESGALPEPATVDARQRRRGRERPQRRPGRAAPAEPGEARQTAAASAGRALPARERDHDVLERRGAAQDAPQTEAGDGAQQRIPGAGALEGPGSKSRASARRTRAASGASTSISRASAPVTSQHHAAGERAG